MLEICENIKLHPLKGEGRKVKHYSQNPEINWKFTSYETKGSIDFRKKTADLYYYAL